MATCEFALLPCPLKCGENIMRKDLDTHLKSHCVNRHYKCRYCGKRGIFGFITGTHDKTCVKKIVPCPNECPQGIPREDIQKHIGSECINTPVACKYKSIGCEAVLRRGDMIKHEQDDRIHLTKSLDVIMKLQEEDRVQSAKVKRAVVKLQNSSTELQESVTVDRAKVQQLCESVTEESAKVQGAVVNLQSCCAELREGATFDRAKSAEVQRDVTKLRNEVADLREIVGANSTVNGEVLIELEARKATSVLVRCGQPVTFKVTGFQQKRRRGKIFTLPPFYTSPTGYLVGINVNANGSYSGEWTHVSILAVLKKGKYDDKIAWPFVGKLSFTLLNQLSDINHHQHVMQLDAGKNARAGSHWGSYEFIPHSELDNQPARNTQYLKDDTLYFRVSVEASGYKHWLECTPDS